ncbi:helix-turn-helix domain-containing protein [Chitinophaga caeni]|uniref:helix-turn-helix domain-containing protein n=1 Tax=Chitinophaga caeni TaxID=2029983 RepID=UPI001E510BF4|nr:helix-turn-helix domain-containing protein [Chitinophaga caeni]
MNVPATHMIQNRILLEAKRLLQASECSIKEIAYELGFNDLAYFSNFFKTQTGYSPRQFKERL